jgi:purine nucleoside phosphorylase
MRNTSKADIGIFSGSGMYEMPADKIEKVKISTPYGAPSDVIDICNGPRFSSKAESKWFTSMGWHTVNMTQYPEVVLAQELGICIVNVAMITDYDAGLVGDVPEVTTKEVVKMFQHSIGTLHKILMRMVKEIPVARTDKCRCHQKPDEAYFF